MLNRWPRPGHWLQFDLRGTACNRDAIGAQVFVEAGERRLRGSVRAGEGFLAASSKRLHFGLAEATAAQRVWVRWPGGAVEEFGALEADRRWLLVQGAGKAQAVAQLPAPAAAPPAPAPEEPHAPSRVPLIASLPMAALPLPGWDAPQRAVGDLAGAPVLINFWSPGCGACLEEFDLFRRRRAPLDGAGLRIVPILVDDGTPLADARAVLASHGLDALGGALDGRAKEALGMVLQETLWDSEDLPLPSSLLLDRRGQLRVIYVGPVRFRDLMQDLQTIAALPEDAIQDPRLCGGRLLSPRLRGLDKLAAKFAEAGLTEAAAALRARQAEIQAALGE
jgi:thiol-disulfide isomerase/thioredoxin